MESPHFEPSMLIDIMKADSELFRGTWPERGEDIFRIILVKRNIKHSLETPKKKACHKTLERFLICSLTFRKLAV